MWFHFVFGCVFEALSGALVALFWMRMRKAEEERALIEQDLEARGEEVGQLQGAVGKQDKLAREQQSALETAQQGLAAKTAELAALQARGAQVELEMQRRSADQDARRQAAVARTAELEGELESRDKQLAERAAAVQGLQKQVADQQGHIDAGAALAEELKRTVEQLSVQGSERLLHVQAAAGELSARLSELEDRLAGREQELAERAAALERARAESSERAARVEALEQRSSEFAQELQRVARAAHERLRTEQESSAAMSARGAELERQLEQRAATNLRLQGEVLSGEGRCEALGARVAELEQELRRAAETHDEQLRGAQAEREERLRCATAEHDEQLRTLIAEHGERLNSTNAEHDERLRITKAEHDEQLRTLIAEHDERLQGANAEHAEHAERLRCAAAEQEERLRSANAEHEEHLRSANAEHEEHLLSANAAHEEHLRSATTEHEERLRSSSAEHEEHLRRVIAELEERALSASAEQDELLRSATAEYQDRLRREQELQAAACARAGELDNLLVQRLEDLRRSALDLDGLRAEVAAGDARAQELVQRQAELERQVELEKERAADSRRLDDELQCALSARTSELEARVLCGVEELNRQSAAMQALQADRDEARQALELARRRCDELDQRVQQSAQQQDAQLAAAAARSRDLEAEIARKEWQIGDLRVGGEKLSDRCAAVSGSLEQRSRDVEERDRSLAQLGASLDALTFSLESCHGELVSCGALIDELAGRRIEAHLQRAGKQRPDPAPKLYLQGLRTGDLPLALRGLLGDGEPLSEASAARVCDYWRRAHDEWRKQPLTREVAYLWADGVRVEAGCEREGDVLLVLVAVCVDGARVVLAAEPGDRASKEAWLAILKGLAQRGLGAPRIVVADEALGLWGAIDELGWTSARQHCWNRKTEQVVAALPRPRRAQAVKMLRATQEANSRTAAKQARDKFAKRCGVRLAPVGELVTGDWKQLTSFHAFPKAHWEELATTAPIEALLATLRLAAEAPKTSKPEPAAPAILWKLLSAAAGNLPPLDALELVPSLVRDEARTESDPAAESKLRAG